MVRTGRPTIERMDHEAIIEPPAASPKIEAMTPKEGQWGARELQLRTWLPILA